MPSLGLPASWGEAGGCHELEEYFASLGRIFQTLGTLYKQSCPFHMLPFALLVTPELRGHPLFPGFPYLWAQHRAHSVQFEENVAMWVYGTPGSSQMCPDSGSCPT